MKHLAMFNFCTKNHSVCFLIDLSVAPFRHLLHFFDFLEDFLDLKLGYTVQGAQLMSW